MKGGAGEVVATEPARPSRSCQTRLAVPYVDDQLAPETRALGEQLGAEFYDLTGNEHGYFELLSDLWKGGEAFALVEMDIVPPAGFMVEFSRCPHDLVRLRLPATRGFEVAGRSAAWQSQVGLELGLGRDAIRR